MEEKKTTIFRELLTYIVFPVIAVLLVLFTVNFFYIKGLISDIHNINEITEINKRIGGELIKIFFIFIPIMIIFVWLLSRQIKNLTKPIERLTVSVKRIIGGHFKERAEVIGYNEIAQLSRQFNTMLENIENYYNELEQKVRERTAEIAEQKEEIENQRNAITTQRDELAQKNKALELAYKQIESQKKDITDSIFYAKRIQTALIPSVEYFKTIFPDSFIYFHPKAIVSGDFYWVKEHDGKAIVAAVDCTGHGVPGAFMSVLGSDQLNSIVKEGIIIPSEILNTLNSDVTELLGQKSMGSESIRDGMDLALCTIDINNKIVEFAGANNPLLLVRKGELIIYDGNKFPIGGFYDSKEHKFTNHQFNFEKGDVIYLFSDGYVDQFGGPKGRKFMIQQFKSLLIQISKLELIEQLNVLDQTFKEWKGEKEQVDDILVIGIRL